MSLLFSISYYTPYVSGLTLYVSRLVKELKNRKYQVTVMTNRHTPDLASEETIEGVRVVRAKPILKLSKGFLSIDFILKSLREAKKSEAIVINLPQFEGWIPAIWGKIFGKKVIAIYHCEVVLPPTFLNLIILIVLYTANFITLLICNEIVTYTQDFAENSRMLPFFNFKTRFVYPPIPVPKVNNRVKKLINYKIGKKPKFLIGVAARLAAEKGIEYLLEAIPLLEEKFNPSADGQNSLLRQGYGGQAKFKIIIAGSVEPVGEEKYKDKILKLVEKYRDYVVFLGELKEEEMGSFYSILDVLVLPSVNSTEAFGMVQVEAMMTGIPVVATSLSGVRVPIKKTGMGISVPVKDSLKLAESIIEVIFNKSKFIKEAEIIKSEFSITKTVNFYLRLFSE